jgi:NifU-like protein involved in Fe-S cluster formation
MKLMIKVGEDGIISDVKFKTFGCGSAIASSSYMTERVKGLSLEAAGAIKNTEIAREVRFPFPPLTFRRSTHSLLSQLCLPPVKLHCSMLAEDAIKAAINDYKKKREANGGKMKAGHIDVSQSVSTGATTATAHPGSGAA